MFHKQQCWAAGQQQLLQLHAGEHIHVIQGLVPDVQVCALTEAGRQQHLFLLARAVFAHILFKLGPREVQLAEDGLPLIWDLWYSERQCYARLKDQAGYDKCLAKGKEAYGMSEEELRNLKVR